MSARAGERMHVEQGLRRALATDSLAVDYQPCVDLAERRIVGVEALVRRNAGLLRSTAFGGRIP